MPLLCKPSQVALANLPTRILVLLQFRCNPSILCRSSLLQKRSRWSKNLNRCLLHEPPLPNVHLSYLTTKSKETKNKTNGYATYIANSVRLNFHLIEIKSFRGKGNGWMHSVNHFLFHCHNGLVHRAFSFDQRWNVYISGVVLTIWKTTKKADCGKFL